LKIQLIIVHLCGFKLFLGKVIGNIWATRKYEALKNFKLMIVQPLNSELEKTGDPIVAVDTVLQPQKLLFHCRLIWHPWMHLLLGLWIQLILKSLIKINRENNKAVH